MGKAKIRTALTSLVGLPFLISFSPMAHGAEGQVSFQLAQKAAVVFAQEVFPEAVFGPAQIYYGLDNEPAVYVFALSLKKEIFPREDEILAALAEGRRMFERGQELADEDMINAGRKTMVGEGEYGMIMVSCRYEMGPVIEYYAGLPLHYASLDKAREKAVAELGAEEPELARCVFYTPFDIWLEFVSKGDVVFVSPFTLESFSTEEVLSAAPLEISEEQSEKAKQDWLRVEQGEEAYVSSGQFRIPNVPDFDWSYGCSPTAAADILGYWDANGYPLLIDYYFDRWDHVESEWDNNVPNVQQQLAIAMHTDTLTGSTNIYYICPGIEAVCNHAEWGNNYHFASEDFGDDWARLIADIDCGRPLHWGLHGHPTYNKHSVCAMGWGPPDNGWICIHDTWSSTPEEVVIDYDGWGGARYVRVVDPNLLVGFDRFSPNATVNMAWGDYDNDQFIDIAVSSADPYSGLYRNNQDGTFTKTSSLSGWGFSWGDYDNDGDIDLAASQSYQRPNKLYVNNGDGTFTESDQFDSCYMHGYDIQWADCDNDGDLDAAVGNAGFYRNNGDGTFTKMGDNNLYANAVAWGDYDNDGDPDLAVARHSGNKLLKNNGSFQFQELDEFGDYASCWELEWADYDADGYLDLAIGTVSKRRLYRNNSGSSFTEIDCFQGTECTRHLAWGDYDSDGDLDLAAANDIVDPDEAARVLYINQGGSSFTRQEFCAPIETHFQSVWGDYDNDGDLDLAFGNYDGQDKLYRNSTNGDDFVKVHVIGRRRGSSHVGYSNRSGIGAKVSIFDLSKTERLGFREISSEGSALLTAHFGVQAGNTYEVEVCWPTSGVTMDTLVTAPAAITLWEYCRGDANGDRIVNVGDIVFLTSYLYRQGPPPDPINSGDADANGTVDLGDIVYLNAYLYHGGPPPPPPSCL